MEKEVKQIAGATIMEFTKNLVSSIDEGWKMEEDSATHFWPSTFFATMWKEKEVSKEVPQEVQKQTRSTKAKTQYTPHPRDGDLVIF